MITKIYLTRHGQTQWNLEGRLQGSQNSDLTDFGKSQAGKLRERIGHIDFDAVYTSSSGRAIDTAKILNAKGAPLNISNDIVEMAFGEWEGKFISEVKAESPDTFETLFTDASSYVPVSGESFDSLIQRADTFIDRLVSKHKGETVLVVSHGITTKALLVRAEDRKLDTFWEGPFIQGCSLSLIEVRHSEDNMLSEVVLHGDTAHFED